MNKKLIICYLLLVASLSVTAKKRKATKFHKTSLYRSLEPDITTTEEEVEIPKNPSKTKLILIKPRSNEADEGRFLKHILLYKSLMQPQKRYPDYTMPYIIVNNPTNLTNINNNTLTNVPQTVTATATGTGTGTGTAGAGAGGAGAGAGGVRIAYIRDSEALPYALPMPMSTPVYQQRQQPLPQIVYGVPLKSVQQNNRKRIRYGNANANQYNYENPNKRRTNPFSSLANSLRRIQFL